MTDEARSFGRTFCAVSSAEAREDMIATVWAPHAMVLVEAPLPWTADPRSYFGEDLLRVRSRAWKERAFELGLVAIAPDPEYSVPGRRRVIWQRRLAGEPSGHERIEYVVHKKEIAPLLASLVGVAGAGPRFERHRVVGPVSRDLVLCTHGTVDACCGKLGFPAYQRLRDVAGGTNVRVWRGSHFGGHRFAPTVLDMPEGRFWGRLDEPAMRELVHRNGDASALRAHYRGWAGLAASPLAVVERELLARLGWAWTRFIVEGEVLALDQMEQRAEVRVSYRDPETGDAGSFRATVEAAGSVSVGGCGLAGSETRQYRVVHLTRQISHVATTVAV